MVSIFVVEEGVRFIVHNNSSVSTKLTGIVSTLLGGFQRISFDRVDNDSHRSGVPVVNYNRCCKTPGGTLFHRSAGHHVISLGQNELQPRTRGRGLAYDFMECKFSGWQMGSHAIEVYSHLHYILHYEEFRND